MNPGTGALTKDQSLRKIAEFLHFGPFLSGEDEGKYLQFWRQWSLASGFATAIP